MLDLLVATQRVSPCRDPDKPPTSFYLLRVSPKPPCMVLRLAFLGGMSGKERNEVTGCVLYTLSMTQESANTYLTRFNKVAT